MAADEESPRRRRRSKGRVVAIVSLVLVLLVAAGTTAAVVLYGGDPAVSGQALAPPEPTEEEEELVVVVADDGKSQVTVPESWGPASGMWRAEGSALHVGNTPQGQHVAVWASDKDDFVSFDAFNSSVRTALEDAKEISRLRKPNRTTVGGLRAVEHRFRDEVDGIKTSYRLVTVKGKAAYYEIQGWANTDQESPDMDTIGAVIDSFREVTDGSKG